MRSLAALAIALLLAAPARAQEERPLGLEEAVAEAAERALPLVAAEGEAAIAAARARGAAAFLWPRAEVGLGVVRSTDPVFAFGSKLRQGVFAEADLALDALNDPAAVSDWEAALDVRWGALDPARWAGWSAARSAAEAAGWGAVRTAEATALRARVLYWSAVGATARREAAEASLAAAAATRDLFGRRHERGLLTDADRLRADAEHASARAAAVDAERAEREARRDLGLFLGWPADRLPVPVDTLAPPAGTASAGFEPAERADVRALGAALAARRADRRAADRAWWPSVQAFGRLAGHGDGPGPDADDWTVGVALAWTAFDGFARGAGREAAGHAVRIARLQYERALDAAAAEVDLADRAVTAAAAASEAAVEARSASSEAATLVRRRFEEGLATATDVLQAEARAAAARSGAADALAAWRIAAARAAFARSATDPEGSR